MNRIKKAVRIFAFVCLIVLASVGVGLSGGIPLPTLKKRRDAEKENIELIENQSEKSDTQQDQIKS